MSRPEDSLAADIYYNDVEARKYTTSSRIQTVQAAMTARALALLALPHPSLILDIGCGSGLSGEMLSSAAAAAHHNGPHAWIGMDLSPSMLDVALRRDVAGDLLLADMGQGVPFRAGTFDAAVSISAIQWLCSVESSSDDGGGGGGSPATKRLRTFFDGLYAALRRGARAVCQFYPRNEAQREMVTRAAVAAGFAAGILEDDPGTKNVKLYLVLSVGGTVSLGGGGPADITAVVRGMDNVEVVRQEDREAIAAAARRGKNLKKGSKAWIVKKKEQMERKGKVVKATSKYTGRKRRIAF